MFKRCVSFVVTLLLLVSSVNTVVFADEETNFTGFGMEKLIKSKPVMYEDFENYSYGFGTNKYFAPRQRRNMFFPKKAIFHGDYCFSS